MRLARISSHISLVCLPIRLYCDRTQHRSSVDVRRLLSLLLCLARIWLKFSWLSWHVLPLSFDILVSAISRWFDEHKVIRRLFSLYDIDVLITDDGNQTTAKWMNKKSAPYQRDWCKLNQTFLRKMKMNRQMRLETQSLCLSLSLFDEIFILCRRFLHCFAFASGRWWIYPWTSISLIALANDVRHLW